MTRDFPRPSEYLGFYKKVSQELKRRHLKMLAGTGAAFTQPEFSRVKVNYRSLTLDQLQTTRRQQIETIARVDIHFYPINHDFTARAIQQADMARANGKRLVIGETWLYKASESEVGGASAVEIIARDVFSFWQPLDEKFLTLVTQFARAKSVEFMSPFWSKYFFGCADYNQVKRDATNGEILRVADAETAQNIAAGMFSGTGLTYRNRTGIE